MISETTIQLSIIIIYGVAFLVICYFAYKLNFIETLKLILKNRSQSNSPLYNVIIIGPRTHDYYSTEDENSKINIADNMISLTHDSVEYIARKDQAYRFDYNLIEKLINKRDCEYSLIFYEAKDKDKEPPQSVRPPDINTKVEGKQFITSNLLYRVWKYRGVKPAFRDEFKEPVQFNVPTWAIVIVVIVFVVAGGFIALKSGALDMAIEAIKGGTVQ